jgi:UDP-N-acetyl-D-mannosaminuronic acid transferase (WecB/TagA/CpsF family)
MPMVIARQQEGLLTVLDDHLYRAVKQNMVKIYNDGISVVMMIILS